MNCYKQYCFWHWNYSYAMFEIEHLISNWIVLMFNHSQTEGFVYSKFYCLKFNSALNDLKKVYKPSNKTNQLYIYIYISSTWELIFIYCGLFVLILVFFFCVVSSFTTFHYVSGLQVILPRPRIGMMSLVTVSPVITAFCSCCLSHHVFDQVNLWPFWVWFETAIFWLCSPGTVETQRLYPLCHGPRRAIKNGTFWSYKSLSGLP